MDHTLSQLQALLDEAERTQTSVSASWAGRLHALASQAARLGSGSFLAIEYRAIFPLLELPDSVVSLILSHLPAARLAACMHTCRAFQRHLGEAAISMRLTRLEQVLPTVQPGEAVTHALRFAEMLAASPPATLGAGESHTLCLGREGVLLSCGGDYLDDDQRWPFVGHLGHGQEWDEAVARPSAVRLPAGVRARAVAGGGYVSLCLSCAHEAWSWGGYGCGHGLDAGNVPRPKRLPLPLPAGGRVALLACGSQHCLLLDSEGQIWASGRNLHGELGVGDTQPRTRPSRLDALPSHTRFCALSAGGSHSLAVEAGGAVLSWGHGGAGRLGHGDEKPQHLPKRVDALVGAGAGRLVAAGGMHSLFVAGGLLYSCGFKGDGRLGVPAGPHSAGGGVHKPQLVRAVQAAMAGCSDLTVLDPDYAPAPPGLRQIACGDHHNVALIVTPQYGTRVYTWGKGEDGRLGHGHEKSEHIPRSVATLAALGVVEVGAGSDHTIVRAADGRVYVWGLGSQGQLGLGDLDNRALPQPLELDQGISV